MINGIVPSLILKDPQPEASEPPFRVYRIAGVLISMLLLVGLMASDVSAVFPFPRPSAIEPNIKFWVDIFATYGERDFIVHDRDQVWRTYQVLHLPGDGTPSRIDVDTVNDYLKTKFSDILNRLASGQAPSDYEERRVAELFRGEPLSAYALGAQNLRVQEGMRERFREGLLRSRYYRSSMERIFNDAGLPPELVALAEVESGFDSRAHSSAGAVGIWQFTRGTGQQFMRITRYHDDRFDPETETAAAAKLLRSNYLTFGSWPLAITAYDYGSAGMAEAAGEYASDYARIVRNYAGPHFGFASKNYYAEFLAALQINQFEDAYFPDIRYDQAPPPPPVRTDFAPRRIVRRRVLHRVVYHRRHRHHHRRRLVASSERSAHKHHRPSRLMALSSESKAIE
ncbi:MAG TPA: lytic transglycosylase domain-containing protein [Candidatus Binataceae bacterium]|nr:lytic transglycosylase domain-containing protein [Candidatus Binataceae bacterium]